MTRGSCLCGEVAYELDSVVDFINHCHCSRCRKAHGAAFGSLAHAAADGFRWTRGANRVTHFESSPGNERTFCSRCGAGLPVVSSETGRVRIPAGTLDDDPGARPVIHIYVGSKAPWFEISDALPCFDELPPGAG